MKGKTGIVAAVIVVVVLGLAGAKFLVSNNAAPSTGVPERRQQDTNPVNTAFTSIKDALSKSVTLECNYTDETGKQTKSYIKNGAVRADFTAAKHEDSGSIIVKDKKMYLWNDQKQGFTMDLSSVPTGTGKAGNTGSDREEEMMQSMEKYKEQCKPGVVSDSLFTPPSDVTFSDFSTIFAAPTGSGNQAVPSIDQSNIQEYMDKYGNQVPGSAYGD